MINFDDDAASRLQTCAIGVAQSLRGDGAVRTVAVQHAVQEFAGAHAELFTAMHEAERRDRTSAANALDDLAQQLAVVQRQASEERIRQREHTAWRAREHERRTTVTAGALDPMLDWSARALDPEPSDTPIRPMPIDASFRARPRRRSGGGSSGGRSSADPERLRAFAQAGRRLDTGMRDDLVRFRNAWSSFTAGCGWARIDNGTLVGGLGDHLRENAEDADWADRIATAFAVAGGGCLADTVLDVVGASTPLAALHRLLDPTLTPTEVAAAWAALGLSDEAVRAFPLSTQLAIAGLDGLPAHVRDVGSRSVLAAAVADPDRVYRLLGLPHVPDAVSLADFVVQVNALVAGVGRADDAAARLPAPSSHVAQLVGLGVADGALVAAISLGDLDRASNVTVNVPGAGTTVDSATEKVRAANALLRSASAIGNGASFAVVSWFGYRAPSYPEVESQARARAGGVRLASFMDGITDSRSTGAPNRITVAGHSYGSTTAAEALAQTRHRVSSFVTYGSVGFTEDTMPEHLNVDHVFATEADHDHVADIGRVSGRTDPRDVAGVAVFSSEAEAGTQAVTAHDMYPQGERRAHGVIGYLSSGSSAQRHIARIVARGRP